MKQLDPTGDVKNQRLKKKRHHTSPHVTAENAHLGDEQKRHDRRRAGAAVRARRLEAGGPVRRAVAGNNRELVERG